MDMPNLAYLSAKSGKRTLLWDLDPQGAASFYFRIYSGLKGGAKKLVNGKRELESSVRQTDHLGLELVPADFSLRNLDLLLKHAKKPKRQLARMLSPLLSLYDHVYLDCPPSISLLSENVFAASDVLLVPSIPSTLSLRTFEQLSAHLQAQGVDDLRVIPFFCMVDRRKRLHRDICATMCSGQYSFLNTFVLRDSAVERMGVERAPVFEFDRASPAADAYDRLWREIMAMCHAL